MGNPGRLRERHLASRSAGLALPAREEARHVRCAIGLLGRPASEYGRLCPGDGGHEGGHRRRSACMLTILIELAELPAGH